MQMQSIITATFPVMMRAPLEPLLPEGLQVRWFASKQEAVEMAPGAQIGWFDMVDKDAMSAAIVAATEMRWLNSLMAGMDGLPLSVLRQRGVVVTNGVGINALTIAEYVLMGMLTIAKDYRSVVHAQQRHEWLKDSPGKVELAGTRALVLGYGAIGQLVEPRLQAMGVDVTVVRRTPDGTTRVLGPDQWRARLGAFDWVILAVPGTEETRHMIGADELAAMKRSAVLINVARGSVVDQDALVRVLQQRGIGAAFLDVTEPEPLPPDHPLWSLDNAHITMHLSGRAQDRMVERAGARFLDNLARYRAGTALQYQVDLARGY